MEFSRRPTPAWRAACSATAASMSGVRPAWLPLLVALVVVAVWGATPVVTKLAAVEIDPLLVALLRTVCGGIPALPLLLVMGVQPPRDRRLWGPLLLSAFCGFIAFPLLFTYGQRQTSAMHGGLILAMLPVLTGLYAALIERRRPAGRWWAGCVVAFAGEILLIGGRGLGNGATRVSPAMRWSWRPACSPRSAMCWAVGSRRRDIRASASRSGASSPRASW